MPDYDDNTIVPLLAFAWVAAKDEHLSNPLPTEYVIYFHYVPAHRNISTTPHKGMDHHPRLGNYSATHELVPSTLDRALVTTSQEKTESGKAFIPTAYPGAILIDLPLGHPLHKPLDPVKQGKAYDDGITISKDPSDPDYSPLAQEMENILRGLGFFDNTAEPTPPKKKGRLAKERNPKPGETS